MFTGLIETIGTLTAIRSRSNYRLLTVRSSIHTADLVVGESVTFDGACMTIVAVGSGTFGVEASQETVKKTILAGYRTGSRVNLERALKAGGRLGGHFVTGHVDDLGSVDYIRTIGDSLELAVKHDPVHDRLVVDKGSIAINGVSLTVNSCRSGWFTTNIIPHTANETNLGKLGPDSRVNLEFDLIGKYVSKAAIDRKQHGITIEKLIENGW